MRWDARGTMALVVSALVGITAGVIVGLTTGSPDESRAGEPSSLRTSTTPAPDDPLGVGAPLQNVPCNGKTILVVGAGETTGAMSSAISANPKGEVKYLESAHSCNTLYGGVREKKPPTYVAYMGPFDSLAEPCGLRMSVDHRNDVVTSMKPGVKIHVQCLCVLDPSTFPTLSVGMIADTRVGIYVRALQRLLIDIDQNPTHHVTGRYDTQTANMIKPLQRLNALDPAFKGVVERQTWGVLRDRACVDLDF